MEQIQMQPNESQNKYGTIYEIQYYASTQNENPNSIFIT